MRQLTDEQRERRKEYMKAYRKRNLERGRETLRKWREKNKERYLENDRRYARTPMGRADMLIGNYRKKDRKLGRGVGDLTPKWIVENIFNKPCAHCGKTGWQIIGCNRLDNSKPHSKDNVEPCCKECNDKLGNPPKSIDQIDPVTGEVVRTWNSSRECKDAGFASVDRYCKGVAKRTDIYKGYKWNYIVP